MKLVQLKVTRLFGHVDFDISFESAVTFLIGVNGSGKTTVLRLLSALLEPDVDTLARISLSAAILTVEQEDGTKEFITLSRSDASLQLGVSGVDRLLTIPSASLTDADKLRRACVDDPVLGQIRSWKSPLLLQLGRQRGTTTNVTLTPGVATWRDYMFSTVAQHAAEVASAQPSPHAIDMEGVAKLIRDAHAEIKSAEARLATQLRHDLLIHSLSYVESQGTNPIATPANIQALRDQLAKVKSLLSLIDLGDAEVDKTLASFTERLEAAFPVPPPAPKKGRGSRNKTRRELDLPAQSSFIANAFYLPRLQRFVELLATSHERQAVIQAPLARFLETANRFLRDTGHALAVRDDGGTFVERGVDDMLISRHAARHVISACFEAA